MMCSSFMNLPRTCRVIPCAGLPLTRFFLHGVRSPDQDPVSLFSHMNYPFLVWRRGGVRWVAQAEISLFSLKQAVPDKDDPVEVLLVPLLVRDHDDGLCKLAVHGPKELQYSP